MNISCIATFKSPFPSKFGVPKQSNLVEDLVGEVWLLPKYADPAFVRGIEGFDYVWLLWEFNANRRESNSSVVRPPVLGGNEKVGVFATRSPFRPNRIGLSSVRLLSVEHDERGTRLRVAGADLLDGTPIVDIKPYIPYTDSHEAARAGFVDSNPRHILDVEIPSEVATLLGEEDCRVLRRVLALDPRPQYQDDPRKVYGMPYKMFDVKFSVAEGVCHVISVL